MCRRHFDTIIIESCFTLISCSDYAEDDTISRFYLFYIGVRLVSEYSFQVQDDRGHSRRYERERTMLELSCRVGF